MKSSLRFKVYGSVEFDFFENKRSGLVVVSVR